MTEPYPQGWTDGALLTASPPEPPRHAASPEDDADWLRRLDWREFEHLVGQAYQLQGYDVLPTAHGADGGIDLILTRGTERVFVQCKHWRSAQVGVQVVRELYGLVAAHQATWGVVVASGHFSAEAKEFARTTRLTLLDGPAVAQLLAIGRVTQPNSGTPVTSPSPVPPPVVRGGTPDCPICTSPMKLRTARRGADAGNQFWGCSRFPGCKGIRNLTPAQQSARAVAARVVGGDTPLRTAGRRKRLTAALASFGLFAASGVAIMAYVGALPGMIAGQLNPQLGSPSKAPSVAAGSIPFGDQPMDIAVDAKNHLLYTANYVSGDVTVIDARTLRPTRTIDVAGKPVGIAVDPSHHRIFVADAASKKIRVLDTASGKTTATFATKSKPVDVAFDAGRQRLYVGGAAGTLEAINTANGTRVSLQVGIGKPSSVAIDTSEHKVYALSTGVAAVYSGFTLARLDSVFLYSGNSLAVDSQRQRLYAVKTNGLVERNLLTGKTRNFRLDGSGSVCVDPSARVAYVADPDTNQLSSIALK
jgi:YVTN family beta-propeller protein